MKLFCKTAVRHQKCSPKLRIGSRMLPDENLCCHFYVSSLQALSTTDTLEQSTHSHLNVINAKLIQIPNNKNN